VTRKLQEMRGGSIEKRAGHIGLATSCAKWTIYLPITRNTESMFHLRFAARVVGFCVVITK
jgi:hypothetical protein